MVEGENTISENLKVGLRLKSGSTDILQNRESSQLEFKETFNLGSRAKYGKSLAAFANNRGGYIVFGVTNEPRRLKGLNIQNFESCDPARITEFLNAHFSPELAWEMDSVNIDGVTVGYLYVHEAQDKPVVAIATNGSDIHEAAIYYRYRGQSSIIKFPELHNLIEERVLRERRAWMQHVTSIGRAGPTNVGIIDTIRGKLFGGGPPFLIDESLLRKLKFVRGGQFRETEGAPTLRLVGDLQPVAGVIAQKSVHIGIHSDDLITAFLAQRPLDATQAVAYLRETVFQSTPFVPIHYFYNASEVSEQEVRAMFKDCSGASPSTKIRVLQRLFGGDRVAPEGKVDTVAAVPKDLTMEQFMAQLASTSSSRSQRSLLLAGLRRDPRLIDVTSLTLSAARLSEAVTHLTKNELSSRKTRVFDILLTVFEQRFAALKPVERTHFRKAISRCDELLFAK